MLSGIFAKEVIIGTIIPIYTSLEGEKIVDDKEEGHTFSQLIGLAFSSIPKNFASYFKSFSYFFNSSDEIQEHVMNENNISSNLKRSIRRYFDSWYSVVAYLLFILLYFPCISVFGVMMNEIGLKWAIISAFWSTGYAYLVACVFYQVCNYIIK